MASATAASYPGVLHSLGYNVAAFEPSKPLVRSLNINTLLWVGGLGDTLGSVTYPFTLVQALSPTWSLMICSLNSSGSGWGVGSLQSDVRDLQGIVGFVKKQRPGGNVVIMGHSTGCQDCMEYVVGKGHEGRPAIDGIILQAPLSDREALETALPQAYKHEADQLALKMCREGHDKDALPNRLTRSLFGPTAVSAKRWIDISSPGPDHPGADDYFSSDLPVARLKITFGKIPPSVPLLILYSGADEYVSDGLNKQAVIDSWSKIVQDSGGIVDDNGGIVPNASHNLNGDEDATVQDLVKKVLAFTANIDGSAQALPTRM